MLKFHLPFLMLLVYSNADACSCASRTVERVGLLSKNIIKVKVVKSGIGDYATDLIEKMKSIISNRNSFDQKIEALKERNYKIQIIKRLKGGYEGDQIHLGTGTSSAVRIDYGDEFYIYFDDKPNVGICNRFFDNSINPNQATFAKRLREYLNSPKPDIESINLKEWTLIAKSTSHTVYAKPNAINKRSKGNKIV